MGGNDVENNRTRVYHMSLVASNERCSGHNMHQRYASDEDHRTKKQMLCRLVLYKLDYPL